MSDESRDVVEELERLLRVDPSPGFAARAAGQALVKSHRIGLRKEWSLAAALLVVCVAVGGLWIARSSPIPVRERVREASIPMGEEAIVKSEAPIPPSSRHRPANRQSRRERLQPEAKVLIPEEEIRALNQWLADVASGRVNVPPEVIPPPANIPELPAIPPIEIEPITIAALSTHTAEVSEEGERQ